MMEETALDEALKKELCSIADCNVLFDEPMWKHSTIGIGGNADSFLKVQTISKLKEIVAWCASRAVPYCVWGNGSNTLVKDGGIEGVVISLGEGFDFINIERKLEDIALVHVGAAVRSNGFIDWCIAEGISKGEFISGMPGTIGGNVLTNAGSFGHEISQIVDEISVLEKGGRELTLKRAALDFCPRKLRIPRSTIVLSVKLNLNLSSSEAVKLSIEELHRKREQSQPLGKKSLGCAFKNPPKMGAGPNALAPANALGTRGAGQLIDDAGFKGVRVGRARVSEKHANFIINEGGASARDVMVLMGLIKEKVNEKFGVLLEPEIAVMGVDEKTVTGR